MTIWNGKKETIEINFFIMSLHISECFIFHAFQLSKRLWNNKNAFQCLMNKIVFLQATRSLFTEQASKCVMDTRDSDLGDDSMVSGVDR